jgi:hypothetical protein
MATTATQWNLVVDAETDRDVREFLAQAGDPGGLSRFVEEAVKDRVFCLSVARAKQANLSRSPEEIQSVVDEAVDWARGR